MEEILQIFLCVWVAYDTADVWARDFDESWLLYIFICIEYICCVLKRPVSAVLELWVRTYIYMHEQWFLNLENELWLLRFTCTLCCVFNELLISTWYCVEILLKKTSVKSMSNETLALRETRALFWCCVELVFPLAYCWAVLLVLKICLWTYWHYIFFAYFLFPRRL